MNRPLLLSTLARRATRQPGRTLAMAAGIALGVVATVLLFSLAGRVKERFRAFLDDAYPADGIVVFAGAGPMSRGGPRNLKIEDVEAIAAATGIADWDPLVFAGPKEVRAPGATESIPVVGLSDKGERVRRRSVSEGSYLSPSEVASRAHVALVGETTAARLFPGASAIGATIHVDNVAFEVVGILERRGADPHGGDQDYVVVVPYTTLMDTMLRTRTLSAASFRLDDRARVEPASREIDELLRERHGIAAGQADDFSVFTSASMNSMFRRSFRTFELFVPLIAGTLFLVAALVVLGVQQISIRARRREIGLRRAVGARVADLELQIVLETALVAVAAAVFGLVLAQVGFTLVAPVVARKFGLTEVGPEPLAVAGAVAAALVTGILGALLPARRAARLDPIAALR